MKTLEWGKKNKNGRIVCDLGTRASLLGGDIIAVMKDVLAATPIKIGATELHFVKSPDRVQLRYLFCSMLSHDRFLYFSDDSTLSRMCLDGALYINLDLASCDVSNGPAVFQYLAHLFPDEYADLGLRLIEQCAKPASLGHGCGKFSFVPEWYYEYSGTTLTTLLNNIANIMIGEQIANIPIGTKAETISRLSVVLGNCGWSVPFSVSDVCECFEDITFLKNNPVYTQDGSVDSMLNHGVILRTMGQKTWDLPGRGCMEKRGAKFNSSLVSGFKHAGDTELLRTLRLKFPVVTDVVQTSWLIEHLSGDDIGAIDDLSVCRRYKIKLSELHELYSCIMIAGFGDIIDTPASRAILLKDYGI